ncbi:hypothetical protein WN51_04504 [Melipona quadrifasciata]|uniref:Uncharacterized protein n=1 Tax=Melipona quadrifasciata TaxID=166423 RepID=A0A0M8ZUV0_9HYME|nr:hypothetical protein WN51_04504 [Melipona quadrifasciata]
MVIIKQKHCTLGAPHTLIDRFIQSSETKKLREMARRFINVTAWFTLDKKSCHQLLLRVVNKAVGENRLVYLNVTQAKQLTTSAYRLERYGHRSSLRPYTAKLCRATRVGWFHLSQGIEVSIAAAMLHTRPLTTAPPCCIHFTSSPLSTAWTWILEAYSCPDERFIKTTIPDSTYFYGLTFNGRWAICKESVSPNFPGRTSFNYFTNTNNCYHARRYLESLLPFSFQIFIHGRQNAMHFRLAYKGNMTLIIAIPSTYAEQGCRRLKVRNRRYSTRVDEIVKNRLLHHQSKGSFADLGASTIDEVFQLKLSMARKSGVTYINKNKFKPVELKMLPIIPRGYCGRTRCRQANVTILAKQFTEMRNYVTIIQ